MDIRYSYFPVGVSDFGPEDLLPPPSTLLMAVLAHLNGTALLLYDPEAFEAGYSFNPQDSMKYHSDNPSDRQEGRESISLAGQVERITYRNEDTGYAVARAVVKGFLEPVTVVGNLMALSPGEILEMEGRWENHPRFGRQFRIISHRPVLPVSPEGIRKYLGSGLIKGIGGETAARIVERFGERTLEVIDEHPDELTTVVGIGLKRVEMIRRAWTEQKEVRAIMIFLQEHGVSLNHAAKIFRRYGQRSVAVLSQNPYVLATDIVGIGFQTADKIAGRLGFEKDSPLRAEAGIMYVLNAMSEEGHVYCPYGPLIDKCEELLGADRETIVRAFGAVSLGGKIVVEDVNEGPEEFEVNQKAVFVKRLHFTETGIAAHLHRIMSSTRNVRIREPDRALEWVQKRIALRLAPMQVEAVRRALSDKVLVITGGPGTGKTTIIQALIQVYGRAGARVSLAAPTGRAAKRMTEATGRPASTIHRMLEFSWRRGGFQRDDKRPLEADLVILDEASMIDTVLMYHLLKAVPAGATLVLVGDVSQLPSVGPGDVLSDVIRSAVFPVVELDEIFRQAKDSLIITNAHRINRGLIPETKEQGEALEDFYFIEQEDQDRALRLIMELVSRRIPGRFNMDPAKDIQVLTPMHRGTLGTTHLNRRLQALLNPEGDQIAKGDRVFRRNDKVMQVRNNYEKEVFNGDIGLIKSIDEENLEVIVDYDGRPVPYDFLNLDEIVHAYAISVHKSQGSEYQAVVIPLVMQHYLLLQRNLIYTAVTRGKRLVVMVGSKKALSMGVKNDKIARRYTGLAERLRHLFHR